MSIAIKTFALLILGINSFAASSPMSSFNEVHGVLNNQHINLKTEIERKEFAVYEANLLPQYPVNSTSLFSEGSEALTKDAKRTINRSEDYYDRLPKMLHPNGVCITGEWIMTKNSKYTGYFKNGSRGLFIGRVSTAMEETSVGNKRGFGIAGKLYPTMNPDEKVKTANFFSVDVLFGTDLDRLLDTKTTNEPETGFSFSLMGMALKIASALSSADSNPGFRPLYPISEIGLNSNELANTPKWLRLSFARGTIKNNEYDFRNEVLQAVEDNKVLTINVEASNKGKDRNDNSLWTKLGEIQINEAIVSYGCDRQLHFAHPKIK